MPKTPSFITYAIEAIAEEEELFGTEGILPANVQAGTGRLVVVSGDNASGKSLVGNWMRALHSNWAEEYDVTADRWTVGMASRTSEGMHRFFMYGDETVSSTGDISIQSVHGSFNTSSKRDQHHFFVLDEPDTGLSEEYAAAMGRYIAQFAADLPKLCDGLVVVTHSRAAAAELLPLRPHHIRMGDQKSLLQWTQSRPEERSIEELLALRDTALTRFRAVSKLLDTRRRERDQKRSARR